MGLLRTGIGTVTGVLSDQWKEYFYCDALGADVLAVKGRKRVSGGSNSGLDNIISNGSVIAVADGQCMMIVEQGKVVDVCAEPGEYIYDISTEPSLFAGGTLINPNEYNEYASTLAISGAEQAWQFASHMPVIRPRSPRALSRS